MHCSKLGASFDHLVSAREQRRRYFEVERLSGLQVDRKLELGRLLDRKLGGLLAAQDAVDVGGCLPVLIGQINAIGYQAAVGDEVPEGISRRQAVPRSERDDQLAIAFGERA